MEKNKLTRLPQAELEIMLIVWQAEVPVSSTYILDRFNEKREWALPTLMTVLSRLVAKGYLNCVKEGRNNRYTASVEGNDYKSFYIRGILDDMFEGSVEQMVEALCNADDRAIEKLKTAVLNV